MIRTSLAAIAGYALWTALWLGGNAAFFSDAAEVVGQGQPYTAAGPLVGVIVLSLVCSLAAGLIAAAIARPRARAAVLAMAVLLLVTGIAIQAGVWELMPAWYHVTFLALIVPAAIVGGRLAPRPAHA
jgi:hypothetical protein